MNYTKLFYLIGISDKVSFITGFIGTFILVVSFILFIIYLASSPEEKNVSERDLPSFKKTLKRIKTSFTIGFITGFLFMSVYALIPSRKDAILIVVGGQTLNFLTTDSSASKLPSELSSYLLTEIKSLAKEAELELNVSNAKEKIIQEAENMTSREILKKLKTDTAFANIILK